MNTLYGKPAAEQIYLHIQQTLEKLQQTPSLAIIQVGHHPASDVYVSYKQKAARKIGFDCQLYSLDADVPQGELETLIKDLNNNSDVHGILLQLPLSNHLDSSQAINTINPIKDVDGLTDHQQQLLAGGRPQLIPATALGVIKLLDFYNIELNQQKVVIVGRSALVGLPLLHLVKQRGAVAQSVHRQTNNPKDVLRTADIIITAAGQPELIDKNSIKPGATIIDVGITRTPQGLVGDVIWNEATQIAGAISPVPGGVGPLTIACLMQNVLQAYALQHPQEVAG